MISKLRRLCHTLRYRNWSCCCARGTTTTKKQQSCQCRPAAQRAGRYGMLVVVVVATGAVTLLVVLMMAGHLHHVHWLPSAVVVSSSSSSDRTATHSGSYALRWDPQASFATHNGGAASAGETVDNNQANRRAFQYIIEEPDLCRSYPDVWIISYVHSAVMKAENRQLIRETWGNIRYYPLVRMRVIFVFGSAATRQERRILSKESREYHDIIQLDFVDSYKNLSYKGVSALQWISEHCMQAEWILKSDDDMVINVFGLASFLGHYSRWVALAGDGLPSKILCAVWWGMPVLRGQGCAKWCVSMEEWPDSTYPAYCSGSAFVIPTHLAPRLYRASFDAPFLWVDDAYISGVLAREAGIKHQPIHSLYELNYHIIERNLLHGNRLFCHYPGGAAPRATWWPLIAAREGQRLPDISGTTQS